MEDFQGQESKFKTFLTLIINENDGKKFLSVSFILTLKRPKCNQLLIHSRTAAGTGLRAAAKRVSANVKSAALTEDRT